MMKLQEEGPVHNINLVRRSGAGGRGRGRCCCRCCLKKGAASIASFPDPIPPPIPTPIPPSLPPLPQVTPEHMVPQVVEALSFALEKGLNIPVVYNTSGYDSVESIRLLDGLVVSAVAAHTLNRRSIALPAAQ